MNALILRNLSVARERIPTRRGLRGCISFIPVARSLVGAEIVDQCTINCVRDSIAFGNTDPNLEQECRRCCQTCVENNPNNKGRCVNGCAIGGEGAGCPITNFSVGSLINTIILSGPSYSGYNTNDDGRLNIYTLFDLMICPIDTMVNGIYCRYRQSLLAGTRENPNVGELVLRNSSTNDSNEAVILRIERFNNEQGNNQLNYQYYGCTGSYNAYLYSKLNGMNPSITLSFRVNGQVVDSATKSATFFSGLEEINPPASVICAAIVPIGVGGIYEVQAFAAALNSATLLSPVCTIG